MGERLVDAGVGQVKPHLGHDPREGGIVTQKHLGGNDNKWAYFMVLIW